MTPQRLTQQLSSQAQWPLHSVEQTRAIEHQAQATLPARALMQRAGLATAQLALAIAPHAQKIWIACGPGNNGGDGLEAAIHLQAWDKQAIVTRLGDDIPEQFDLAIDAILGIGAQSPPSDAMAHWLDVLNTTTAPVLCVDTPTGLLADTGEWQYASAVSQPQTNRHTLSLLTLKPGLFTADGRDATGHVWFNNLGVNTQLAPLAWLQHGKPPHIERLHNSHKGSFGDVSIIGGAVGMGGAAVLAGLAALHGGAGRVFAGLIDTSAHSTVTATYPPLMLHNPSELPLQTSTVVCGCGGGDVIHALLPHVLSTAQKLVLDADALNAIARDTSLQSLLTKRSERDKPTVLTPHPLEAARLLKITTQEVQKNRLHAAQQLADTFACTVVLKGSGSLIASPHHTPVINGSGNALLATAGTGDVLAGLIGAYVARHAHAFEATCQAVYAHGQVADVWPSKGPALDAAALAASVR